MALGPVYQASKRVPWVRYAFTKNLDGTVRMHFVCTRCNDKQQWSYAARPDQTATILKSYEDDHWHCGQKARGQ